MRRNPGMLGLVVLFAALLVLHYTIRPMLAWRASVDFLVIGVLLVAVRVRPGAAVVCGVIAGLIADAMAPSSFGAATLAMSIVAFGASWLKASFFAEHIALNAVFLFVAKLAFDVVFLVAAGGASGLSLVTQLGIWTPLSALATAAVGLAVIVLFAPLIAVGDDRL